MTSMSPGPSRGTQSKAENDVYTVLVLIAFLFVLVATLYVGFRAVDLFGTILPPPGS